MFWLTAQRTRSATQLTFSFRMMFERCVSAVFVETPSAVAISFELLPSQMSLMISSWRRVGGLGSSSMRPHVPQAHS